MRVLTWRCGPGRVARSIAGIALVGALAIPGFTAIVYDAAPAAADDVGDRKAELAEELEQLREDLEGTSDDLVEAAVRLRTAESELRDAQARLDTARAALEQAARRDAELADRLAVAEAAVEKAQRDLDERSAEEHRTRDRLTGIAREAYVSSGMAGLSIALDAQSPEQFADRVAVAGNVLRVQGDVIDRLAVEQAETRAREAKLEAGRIQVAELKRQSAQIVVQRRAATAQARVATVEIGRLVGERRSAVRLISARKASEQRRIDKLEAEKTQLAQILRRRAEAARAAAARAQAAPAAPAPGSSTGLSFPVSAPITSGYGWRYHPILGYRRLHAGTDFGAPCGTPVRAAAAGTVVRAGWSGGYGNQIVLDHGQLRGVGVASSYNHLSRIVASGGRVSRGQVIGYSGTTGLSTGCHLHFEVYVNGATVDPMSWL